MSSYHIQQILTITSSYNWGVDHTTYLILSRPSEKLYFQWESAFNLSEYYQLSHSSNNSMPHETLRDSSSPQSASSSSIESWRRPWSKHWTPSSPTTAIASAPASNILSWRPVIGQDDESRFTAKGCSFFSQNRRTWCLVWTRADSLIQRCACWQPSRRRRTLAYQGLRYLTTLTHRK